MCKEPQHTREGAYNNAPMVPFPSHDHKGPVRHEDRNQTTRPAADHLHCECVGTRTPGRSRATLMDGAGGRRNGSRHGGGWSVGGGGGRPCATLAGQSTMSVASAKPPSAAIGEFWNHSGVSSVGRLHVAVDRGGAAGERPDARAKIARTYAPKVGAQCSELGAVREPLLGSARAPEPTPRAGRACPST